jgi:hypothetical protein
MMMMPRSRNGVFRSGSRRFWPIARSASHRRTPPRHTGRTSLTRRVPAKTKARAVRQLESLGYKVTLEPLADTA